MALNLVKKEERVKFASGSNYNINIGKTMLYMMIINLLIIFTEKCYAIIVGVIKNHAI